MAKSTFFQQALLNQVFRAVAYTFPGTVYAAIHTATSLSAAAAAAATAVATVFNVPVGSSIVLNPGQSNAETRTVTATSGAGPYTLTVAALTNSHSLGEPVQFDPLPGASLNEPSGGGYARVSVTDNTTDWSAPVANGTSQQVQNAVAIAFPSPTANWGLATHIAIMDALTVGHMLYYGALGTNRQINNGDSAPTLAIDSLSILEG